jgi:DMSO/TMAO reductase YedYZ heme-binding membrane subunit
MKDKKNENYFKFITFIYIALALDIDNMRVLDFIVEPLNKFIFSIIIIIATTGLVYLAFDSINLFKNNKKADWKYMQELMGNKYGR